MMGPPAADLRPRRVAASGRVPRCLPPPDGVVDQADQDQVLLPQAVPLDEPATAAGPRAVHARHLPPTAPHGIPRREPALARHLRRPDAQGEVPAAREQAAAVGLGDRFLLARGEELKVAADPAGLLEAQPPPPDEGQVDAL